MGQYNGIRIAKDENFVETPRHYNMPDFEIYLQFDSF